MIPKILIGIILIAFVVIVIEIKNDYKKNGRL